MSFCTLIVVVKTAFWFFRSVLYKKTETNSRETFSWNYTKRKELIFHPWKKKIGVFHSNRRPKRVSRDFGHDGEHLVSSAAAALQNCSKGQLRVNYGFNTTATNPL